MMKLNLPKNTIRRFFAIALILSVLALGTHAVAFAHAHAYDEDHCQACHFGHAAIPQAAVQVAVEAPAPISRFVPDENSAPDRKLVPTARTPRAPPVA
jgi:hypothetical protein